MSLSTRDMARLGLLMLHYGKWNGKQLISTGWCGWTTSVSTHWQDLNPVVWKNPGQPDRWGYGMLWWIWDTGAYPGDWYVGPWQSAFTAMGTGGQYITVFPQLDIVVIHKVDIDKDPKANVTVMAYDAILSMLVDSRCATACKE